MNNNLSNVNKHIVTIQAGVRGWLVRRKMEQLKSLLMERSLQESGCFDEQIPDEAFLFNPKVKQVYERIGPFQIPDLHNTNQALVDKCAYRLSSGVIYKG